MDHTVISGIEPLAEVDVFAFVLCIIAVFGSSAVWRW